MQLTVREAAKLLNVSEKTIYRWISEGEFPAHRVHDQYRFNRSELLEWVTSRKTTRKLSPELFKPAEANGEPLPQLGEALKSGGIFHRIGGKDKEAVLRSVVGVMPLPKEVNRDFLLQILLAREALGTTAIGDGIAIPHVRNPIVLHVQHPTITLCFLETPVNFGALDGQDVHALFTMVSPTVQGHLHLLSRLAFALRNPELKELIGHQAAGEQLLEAVRKLESTL